MYVYKYSVDVHLLCMIKVRVRWYTCSFAKNVTTLGKLLLLFCLPLLRLLSINMYKTITRNDLARLGMGTIFLVYILEKWFPLWGERAHS